ncbi:MAG TPA: GH36 C-terminal domain-containing protein, partial [Phycicoccus sp.]|nr:GH36 C-terminal domain-containing protein [Phycicoccus sp.]
DITEADDAERAAIARWIALHKELRPLLHSGRVVRADLPDDRLRVSGVVAKNGSEAVFTVLQTASAPWASPGSVPLPGLDPDRTYRIRVRDEIGLPRFVQKVPPAWWEAALGEGVLATGRALAVVGLAAPVLSPAQGFVLHLTTA